MIDGLCQKCRMVAIYVVSNARECHNSKQLSEGLMVLYDGEARGNLKVVEQELNDEGLEGAAEDEKCNRTCGG